MPLVTGGLVDEARMRRWLANLTRPELLADAPMRALLRAHGHAVPASPVEAGQAAAKLIARSVEALASPRLPSGAPPLPYRVLRTCFLDGVKSRQAAAQLGVSERQLSRERGRAIRLLAAQLAATPGAATCGPPPVPEPFLDRPRLAAQLDSAVASATRVSVEGPPGCGKTALVAAHAATSSADVFWYRIRVGAAARLPAALFELGEHLAVDDPALAEYVRAALPRLDVGLATRLALAALATKPRLLVLDGPGACLDPALDAFLDEVVARLPSAAVIVAGGAAAAPARILVPPLSAAETRALLALAGAASADRCGDALHAWTGGIPRLVAPAARWLAEPSGARAPLEDALRDSSVLLSNLRGLLRATHARAA